MTRAKGPFKIPARVTEYGFVFGSAKVNRVLSRPETGYVCISISTPKGSIKVYASRTGKLRLFDATGKVQVKPRRKP